MYGLGADPSHPPVVHWGSPGHLLGTMAHVVEFLDLPSLRRVGIDFGACKWMDAYDVYSCIYMDTTNPPTPIS